MSLDSRLKDLLGMRKITCGGPIDFTQWQLDSAVRGLRMLVDDAGDLIALPVVVVDVTGPKVIASGIETGSMWRHTTSLQAAGVTTIHVPSPPYTASYLVGLSLDYADATLAVPSATNFYLSAIGPPVVFLWSHEFWLDAAGSFRPSLVVDFSTWPYRCGGGLNVSKGTATLGTMHLNTWGFDVL